MSAFRLKTAAYITVISMVCLIAVGVPLFRAAGDVWTGDASDGFASGTGTEDDPYIIETAEQLAYLAGSVNSGTDYAGKHIKLASDIYLNDVSDEDWTKTASKWQPIGTKNTPFAGSFDGGGFMVSGLYINSSTIEYAGLFGYSNGNIHNVAVGRGYVSGGRYTAALCAYSHTGIVVNCTNGAQVSGTQASEYTGGICGYNKSGALIGCTNTGAVSSSGSVGGICGISKDTVYECTNSGSVTGLGNYTGGICGWSFYSTNGCINSGTVVGGSFAGGVCGVNFGEITYSRSTNAVTGTAYVGGVCGYSISGAKIKNSYNTASVSGASYTGGVCGMSFEDITDCYNTGNISAQKNTGGICGGGRDVSECFNTGKISGVTNIGGICGENFSSVIEICYNIGEISGKEYTGGICGYNYSLILDCLNTASVIGGINTGGICGRNDGGGVATCYSIGRISGEYFAGALIGSSNTDGIVQNCYYLENSAADKEGTVQTGMGYGVTLGAAADVSASTKSLTEAQLKAASSFEAFDFSSVWTIHGDTSYLYPELRPILFSSGIKLGTKTLSLNYLGQQTYITAYAPPNPVLDTTVEWTSSNEQVAKVDSKGRVTAVGEGTAEIKAAIAGGQYWDTCAVTVTVPKLTVSSAAGRPGEKITVDVNIAHNPGFDRISFRMNCTNSSFTFDHAESTLYGFKMENGVFSWQGDGVYNQNGRLATLVFTIADPCENADADVTVEPVSCTNPDIEGEIVWAVTNGQLTVSNYEKGDINKDGQVDARDVTALLGHVNNTAPMADVRHCDINSDGKIDTLDIVRLLNHVNGTDPFEQAE